MAEVRTAASQGGQPCVDGADFLRHGFADRSGHAHDGEGPVAARTAAGRRQLLDRAEASWSIAGDDERSVLKDRTWILLLSFGGLCVSERNSGYCRF